MTKIEMARYIVQALYDLEDLPSERNPEVVKRAEKGTVATLTNQYEMARDALLSKETRRW